MLPQSVLLIVGIATVIAVIWALIKQYEVRMVLFAAGVFMALVAGKPLDAFDAFATAMVTSALIQAICSVMGFAYVVKLTGCDKHLVNLLAGGLMKVRFFLIPGATCVTFAINTALPSAAGVAAAVGTILIPLIISAGVHPATAATAVMAGTFGSMLNPGLSHNPFIAKLAGITPLEVIAVHAKADVIAMGIAAACVLLMAVIFKETKGYVPKDGESVTQEKVNFAYAMVPVIPLTLLLASAKGLLGVKLGVPHAMLIGVIVALAVTRSNPSKMTNTFFEGMASAYGQVLGVIICALVFVSGMKALGLVDAFIQVLVSSTGFVKVAATFGPFLLGLLCGSGDAAAFSFNGAVTPHAAMFGMEIAQMGSLVALSAAISRISCPIVPALIICANIAGVSPMDICKRSILGALLAALSAMLILG